MATRGRLYATRVRFSSQRGVTSASLFKTTTSRPAAWWKPRFTVAAKPRLVSLRRTATSGRASCRASALSIRRSVLASSISTVSTPGLLAASAARQRSSSSGALWMGTTTARGGRRPGAPAPRARPPPPARPSAPRARPGAADRAAARATRPAPRAPPPGPSIRPIQVDAPAAQPRGPGARRGTGRSALASPAARARSSWSSRTSLFRSLRRSMTSRLSSASARLFGVLIVRVWDGDPARHRIPRSG